MISRKPFHKSIIYAIKTCETIGELEGLVSLIRITKIPKNHDAIIGILQKAIHYWGPEITKRGCAEDFTSAINDLRKQKQEAEAEEQRRIREIEQDAREDCN